MSVKLLTEHHLEFHSLKGGCTGLSESTLVKMPLCWKSHVAADMPKSTQFLHGLTQMLTIKHIDHQLMMNGIKCQKIPWEQ